jgi:hypothetical protein
MASFDCRSTRWSRQTKRDILIRRDQRAKRMGCSRLFGPRQAGARRDNGRQVGSRVREEPVDDNKTQREQRLAAALRANLHRRKQQARERGRAESDTPDDSGNAGSEAPDPAGSGGET